MSLARLPDVERAIREAANYDEAKAAVDAIIAEERRQFWMAGVWAFCWVFVPMIGVLILLAYLGVI